MITCKWQKRTDNIHNLFSTHKSNDEKDDCILFLFIMIQTVITLMENKLLAPLYT